MERIKLLLLKVFSYAIMVKSMGQKVTAPLLAAAFPLREIANRFTSGRMHSSAMIIRNVVLHTTNIFLLSDVRLILTTS